MLKLLLLVVFASAPSDRIVDARSGRVCVTLMVSGWLQALRARSAPSRALVEGVVDRWSW